jgi:GH25 family lysozyme M1 (1,4-beta-N-acetylmuramidase)
MTVDPLFVDCYPLDGKKDWRKFIAAGAPWHGAVFKISEGLNFEYSGWAAQQRDPFLEHERYGVDLFDGLYHFLDFAAPGKPQAEFAYAMTERVGGERVGTLPLMVDVERGGQRRLPNRTQLIDLVTAFAERYQQLSGRKPTLYGGEFLRDRQVGSLMGCGRSWVALYGSELHGKAESTADFLRRTGTDLAHLMAWQYDAGKDENSPEPKGYPSEAPGCGKIDISALELPGGLAALRQL